MERLEGDLLLKKYKGIFFDAGDTLLAPHPSFSEIFTRVLKREGHDVKPSEVEETFAEVANFVELLREIDSPTWSTSKEVSVKFWGTVYEAVFKRLGIEDKTGILTRSLYSTFTQFDSYQMFPDALPTLRQVKKAGLILGLISNFEEWLEEMLIHWEVHSMFDVSVISGKEGIEKPDPKIFEVALERSGLTGDEAIYVGDNPELDAAASEGAGMTSVLIDRQNKHRNFDGYRITTLSELFPLLELS